MGNFVLVVAILFGLHCVSCEVKIYLPPRGDTFVVAPGTAKVKIAWTYNITKSFWTYRSWTFISNTTSTRLASIFGDGNVTKFNSSLPEFEIEKPATLVLKNVDYRYNGTYEFRVLDYYFFWSRDRSYVTVFVAAKPNVTINCFSPTFVNEGDDVRCLCTGRGGNPPANVTWFKNDVQIDVTQNEEKELILSNIDKTASGTYKCVAQSYTLKDEKTIEISVYYPLPPIVTSLTSNPEKATIGKPVVITCEAIAIPVPSYIIIHNNTEVVSSKSPYIINVVEYSHAGSYKCIAKNKLGNSSKNYHLSVVVLATRTPNASNTMISVEEKSAYNKSDDGTKWYIVVVSLVSGIVIGILLSYMFKYLRRRFQNKKPQSNPEPETSKVDPIYQDLDLSKMNSEDNYQSLRVNSACRNNPIYENKNDSTYSELGKVRDVENNYQSLT